MIMGKTTLPAGRPKGLPHTHTAAELLYYEQGRGRLFAGGRAYTVAAGCIAVIPAGTPHFAETDEGLSSLFLLTEQAAQPPEQGLLLCRDDSAGHARALAETLYNLYLENRNGGVLAMEKLAEAYTALVFSLAEAVPDQRNPAAAQVRDYIMRHFRQRELDLRAVIAASGYSADRFRVVFRSLYAETPLQYLTRLRIGHAADLIRSDPDYYRVYMLAEACGFSDPFYFSRKFKAVMGMSPEDFIQAERRNRLCSYPSM